MLESVIFPLLNTSSYWRHRALVCLPNIDSRDCLRRLGLTEKEMEDVITKAELRNTNYSLRAELMESSNARPRPDYKEDYRRMISLLLGSLHVFYHSQSYSKSKTVAETSRTLTGGAPLTLPTDLPDKIVQFEKLRTLGDIKRSFIKTSS